MPVAADQVHLLPGYPKIRGSFLVVCCYILNAGSGSVVESSTAAAMLNSGIADLSTALDNTAVLIPGEAQVGHARFNPNTVHSCTAELYN